MPLPPNPGPTLKTALLIVLAVGGEVATFIMLAALLDETLFTLGMDVSNFLVDHWIFGWLFAEFPDLTARDLLAAMAALLFVVIPIIIWNRILEGWQFSKMSFSEKFVSYFILFCYGVIVISEWLLIFYRVGLSAAGGFVQITELERALSVFFSFLFVVVNVGLACLCAHLIQALKKNRKKESGK